jgi:phenylacetate-CoA ligase
MGLFEPDMETLTRTEITRVQDKKLRSVVTRAYHHTRMYRDKFNDLHPDAIRGVQDLEKLPFTTKNDLRSYSLMDRLAVPYVDISRYFSSSGTTGRPVVEGFTQKDMEVTSICCAKAFSCATITKHDKILEPMPAAGLRGVIVAQGGFEKIGAKIIHSGPGRTKELQIPILQGQFEETMQPTVIIGYANYMLRIAEVAENMGLDTRQFGVNTLLCGGEMWSEGRRKILVDAYDAKAYDIFGMLEVSVGPGVAAECQEQHGLHIWENYFLIEVIDPQTGEQCSLNEEGELVITALAKDAHPIIRYRTGDVTRILSREKCGCGRTNLRIGRIIGRTDDRLKVRGIQLYPQEVENTLFGIPGVGGEYTVELREINHVDDMLITVESHRRYTGAPAALAHEITNTFKGIFNVSPRVEIVPPNTMKRVEGRKAQRFTDHRNK